MGHPKPLHYERNPMPANNVVVMITGKDDTQSAFQAVQQNLTKMGEKAQETQQHVHSLGMSFGHFFAAEFAVHAVLDAMSRLREMVEQVGQVSERLNIMHESTGISTQMLSAFAAQAHVSGVSLEQVGRALTHMEKALADARDGLIQDKRAFSDLGISVADLTAKHATMDEVLAKVADGFQKIKDPADRAQAAMAIFGRAGATMLPILEEGSAGIKEMSANLKRMGVDLTEQGVANLAQLDRQMRMVEIDALALSSTFVSSLRPSLETTGKAIDALDGSAGNLAKDLGSVTGDAVNALTSIFVMFDVTLKNSVEYLRMWGYVAKDVFSASMRGIGGDTAGMTRAVDSMSRDWKKYTDQVAKNSADARKAMDILGKPAHVQDAPLSKDGTLGHVPPPLDKKLKGAQRRYKDAVTSLAVAQDRAEEQAARIHMDGMQSILDSMHKQGIISDKDYYAKKLQLMDEYYDGAIADVAGQQRAIADRIQQLRAQALRDARVKSAQLGDETKIVQLQQKLLGVNQQLATLDEQRAKLYAQIRTDVTATALKLKEQADSVASQLENATGAGGKAQIQKQHDAYAKQRLEMANEGATPAQLAQLDQLEKVKEAQTQLAVLDQQISQIKGVAQLKELQIQQQVIDKTKRQYEADKEIRSLRTKELEQLEQLQQTYAQVAAAAGKAGTAALVTLQSTMNTVDQSARNLHAGLKGIFSAIEEGTTATNNFAHAWERAALLVAKIVGEMAMERWGYQWDGGGLPTPAGVKSGGSSGITGFFKSAAHAIRIGKSGGGSAAGVTVNLYNQGTPATVTKSSTASSSSGSGSGSFAAELEKQVVNIFTKDANSNGPIWQMISGATGGATG